VRGGCLGLLALLCSCGSDRPIDDALKVDDFPAEQRPAERLAPVSGRAFGKCSASDLKALVSSYRTPEMMALGGSVFNGVSSMHVNWWLAEWSPPAQVARALYQTPPDAFVDGLCVPHYPDRGVDPFGNTAAGDQAFRLGLDLEKTNLVGLPTTVRHQGWVMSRFLERLTPKSASPIHRTPRRAGQCEGALFNDNVAFGGAAIEDILYGTAKDYRRRVAAVQRRDTIKPDRDKFWSDAPQQRTYASIVEHAKGIDSLADVTDIGHTIRALPKIFFAENSSFVLNPTAHECIDDMTAIDQVLLRQPKRLLVNVGSNSGIFTFLYTGQPIDAYCGDANFTYGRDVYEHKRYVSIRQTGGDEFLTQMDVLLDKLVAEGSGIDHVYVMGHLRPSTIANLKPVGGQSPPGLGKYYARYRIDFAPSGSRTVSGAQVEAADKFMREINEELRKRVVARNGMTKTKFIYVDIDPMADSLDYTHSGDEAHRITVTAQDLPGLGQRKVFLDNRVLKFSTEQLVLDNGEVAGQRIEQGGVFSIDNLHPTVIGYAALAAEVLKAIRATEGVGPDAATIAAMPRTAYAHYTKGRDGNILRRPDKTLSSREDWYQRAFDAVAYATGSPPDCWPETLRPRDAAGAKP
jgi:hypothetical protein